MNVGLFGGTFDPVHTGHLALARAAAERFGLHQVLFVPASRPPHKLKYDPTDFLHRYAMLALALAGEKRFLPSLLEAPGASGDRPNYTIDTVRRLRQSFGRSDKLFLLIGIDAFLDIGAWHRASELLREVEAVIASRPGFALADVAAALPPGLRPDKNVVRAFARGAVAGGDMVLDQGRVVLHLLAGVNLPFSSTQVRTAAARGGSLARFVPAAVADYIRQQHLYRQGAAPRAAAGPAKRRRPKR